MRKRAVETTICLTDQVSKNGCDFRMLGLHLLFLEGFDGFDTSRLPRSWMREAGGKNVVMKRSPLYSTTSVVGRHGVTTNVVRVPTNIREPIKEGRFLAWQCYLIERIIQGFVKADPGKVVQCNAVQSRPRKNSVRAIFQSIGLLEESTSTLSKVGLILSQPSIHPSIFHHSCKAEEIGRPCSMLPLIPKHSVLGHTLPSPRSSFWPKHIRPL